MGVLLLIELKQILVQLLRVFRVHFRCLGECPVKYTMDPSEVLLGYSLPTSGTLGSLGSSSAAGRLPPPHPLPSLTRRSGAAPSADFFCVSHSRNNS